MISCRKVKFGVGFLRGTLNSRCRFIGQRSNQKVLGSLDAKRAVTLMNGYGCTVSKVGWDVAPVRGHISTTCTEVKVTRWRSQGHGIIHDDGEWTQVAVERPRLMHVLVSYSIQRNDEDHALHTTTYDIDITGRAAYHASHFGSTPRFKTSTEIAPF